MNLRCPHIRRHLDGARRESSPWRATLDGRGGGVRARANRPLQDQESRAISLSALVFVDYVVLFGEDSPLELLKIIKPNILVKGGDYQIEAIVGFDLVSSYGGKVISLPLVKGYSTTSIIKRISSGN